MKSKILTTFCIIILLLSFSSCGKSVSPVGNLSEIIPYAESLKLPPAKDGEITIYSGGTIYTKLGAEPVESVAILNGKFYYAGPLEAAYPDGGNNYRHIDLEGRMLAPSFIEAHAHPDLASLLDLRSFEYEKDMASPEEYVEQIRNYLKEHPKTEVLRGTGWDKAAFGDEMPTKELLDDISKDIPIFIRSSDQHLVWVNSKALEVAGIDSNTPDPEGGSIIRDKNGNPSGTFVDMATNTIESALPPISVDECKELILRFQENEVSMGITGTMNAMVLPKSNTYTAYRELLRDGELKVRTQLSFLITPETYTETLDWLEKENADYQAEGVSHLLYMNLVKVFIDGTIIAQTAFMLDDYATTPGFRGEPIWPQDMKAIKEAFKLCSEKGFRIQMHAVGDAAVRYGLDALEAAAKPNRHGITHLELVAPEDIPRFKELDVVAIVNPYWICKPITWETTEPVILGKERSETMFPVKSLYEAGAVVGAASDYPVTEIPNPLIGMDMAVNRTLIEAWRPGKTAEETQLNISEAISVEQAFDAFTNACAYAYEWDKFTGTIEAGKSADYIILDKSFLDFTPSDVKVIETRLAGIQLFQAE